jgi:hypothetical protein
MKARPGPLPEPPADLNRRQPLIATVDRFWFRIHGLDRDPIYFGKRATFRFDAPAGEFGVLYVGADEHCAFIETLGQPTGTRVVTTSSLSGRAWARIKISRALRLIDLAASGGLARIGADGRLFAGEHIIAQRWSQALRAHPARPDGLLYPARHDPARNACALYDHCQDLVTAEQLGCLLDPAHSVLLGNILDTYGFGLIDDQS